MFLNFYYVIGYLFVLTILSLVTYQDSATGLRAAVAAGIAAVGVSTRNPEESLLKAGAAFVIKDYKDSKLLEALGIESGAP